VTGGIWLKAHFSLFFASLTLYFCSSKLHIMVLGATYPYPQYLPSCLCLMLKSVAVWLVELLYLDLIANYFSCFRPCLGFSHVLWPPVCTTPSARKNYLVKNVWIWKSLWLFGAMRSFSLQSTTRSTYLFRYHLKVPLYLERGVLRDDVRRSPCLVRGGILNER
jgi:hypothetical protein